MWAFQLVLGIWAQLIPTLLESDDLERFWVWATKDAKHANILFLVPLFHLQYNCSLLAGYCTHHRLTDLGMEGVKTYLYNFSQPESAQVISSHLKFYPHNPSDWRPCFSWSAISSMIAWYIIDYIMAYPSIGPWPNMPKETPFLSWLP